MAKQDVNFRQGGPITGDSGERGNDPLWGPPAIKPNTDGERAVAANFDRPLENLRKRTEVLRGETEGQKYLQDADMRWVISSGKADGLHDWGPVPPKTEWPLINEWHEWMGDPHNRWYFVLAPNIAVVVQPLNTPARDLQETKYWEFPTPTPANGVNIAMLRRAYSLANIREVVWEAVSAPYTQIVGTHGTPQFLDLTLSGENDHILTITIRDDNATMLSHLAGAFALWNAGYLGPAGFWGSTTGAPGNAVRMIDIPPGDEDYIFEGTADRELHYITAETFRDFFNASLDNLMGDGDTLSVMWEYLVNPDPMVTDGRRQTIPANGNTEVFVPRLFLTSVHPEWIPLGIPLCKRIGKELLWLDGTLATEGMSTPIRFGENGYTVERIMHAGAVAEAIITTPWFGALVLSGGPPWTIDSALNNIIGDLALSVLPSGASRVGMHTTAAPAVSLGTYNVPAPGESIATVFEEIITLLDTKASLNRGVWEAEEKISGRWEFDNHVRIGQDKALIRSVPSNSDWHLVYRNFCSGTKSTPINADVNAETYSVYESANDASEYGQILEVFGGYMVDWNTVLSAADGVGHVSFIKWGNRGTGAYIIGHRYSAGVGVDLNIYDEHDWDYYRVITYNAGEITEKIFGGWGGGRPNTTEIWFIPQEIHSGVSFADISHADGPARITVGLFPWTVALEGIWAMPDNLGWTPNQLEVSQGRALVDGCPVLVPSQTVTGLDTSARWMHDTTLPDPADDGDVSKVPRWYYLWLRRDGQFFVGEKIPKCDNDTATPGLYLYRPPFAECHPGYEEKDYLLVDVVALMQVLGGPLRYYFDVAQRVGGSERRLMAKPLPSLSIEINPLLRHVIASDGGPVIGSMVVNGPGSIRSPGIPRVVSHLAILGYAVVCDACIGVNSSSVFEISLNTNLNWLPTLTPTKRVELRTNSVSADPTTIGRTDKGRVEVSTPSEALLNNVLITQATLTGTSSIDASVWLLGFHWSRSEGFQ